jgi:hypothetical protein
MHDSVLHYRPLEFCHSADAWALILFVRIRRAIPDTVLASIRSIS